MKLTGAALAAALLMAGPALAQGVGPYEEQQDQQGSPSTPQDIVPMPSLLSPEAATGGTQEDIAPQEDVLPTPGTGGMMDEGVTPQGGGESMAPPQGSRSTGEFGIPSGSSLGTESDISETAIPGEMKTVTGTINKINLKKGTMILKTDEGKKMELHADESMLKGDKFKMGSKVTAEYEKQGTMNHVTSLAPAE